MVSRIPETPKFIKKSEDRGGYVLEIGTARVVVDLIGSYLAVGLMLAPLLVFVFGGRIDPGLPGSGVGFRLLIVPGFVLLWPLLALRCLRGAAAPPLERNAHRNGSAP